MLDSFSPTIRNRLNRSCKNCNHPSSDPVSLLCIKCYKTFRRHGSPSTHKPKLTQELKEAEASLNKVNLEEPTDIFNKWIKVYSNQKGSLNRLCKLYFIDLIDSSGTPLMDFKQIVKQTLAVSSYKGSLDAHTHQYRYLLGRASVCLYDQSKHTRRGLIYDKEERVLLQRRPRLFHQAFNDIFLGAGVAKFIAKINRTLKI